MARKILLADDSVTAQNMGRKILADAGYEVIAVNNGSAALKKIAELKPDLVILDVYMPGYSGLEVCQRLKESQETARIPVLLSVGKLEPFKPEEAQRVRADAYIVKPFEASELLSALSKLEDKVVPRAEPTKPGRFARAMAAAEESGRGSQKEKAGDQNGWNSRIGFPHAKTEFEEKVADDSAIYNPMNRDLRTVVETAAEKAVEKKEEKQALAAGAIESIVDVAALATEGLPKDVTPEEVAAITAAAAQIHMAGVGVKEFQVGESRPLETQASETQASETSLASVEPRADRVEDSVESLVREVVAIAALQAGEAVATKIEPQLNSDVKAEETQDQPVTMAVATAESVAAASGNGTRWMAVPVALEGEEATVSLEQEMQKAYAAYAAYLPAESDSAGVTTVPELEVPRAETFSSPEAVAPEVVAPVAEAAPTENFSSSAIAIFEADAEVSPAADYAEPNAAPAPVAEAAASGVETVNAEPVLLAAAPEAQDSQPQESQPAPDAEPAIAEAAAVSVGDFASAVTEDEPAAEYKPDSETVKSTAAAWASWRQVRDTRKDGEAAPAQSKEFVVCEAAAPAETAAAVAAGAEQILQQASPKSDPADIASIVESVLANLRPKLMEEITRKMAEKK